MRASKTGRLAGHTTLWVVICLLFLAFALLTVYQKIAVGQRRWLSDAELMAELRDADFVDDADPVFDRPIDARTWSQWRGQRRDGVTTQPDLLRTWPESGLPTLWKQPGGDGYSSFAAVDGALYSMVSLGNGKEAVLCWDSPRGKERWRHEYEPAARFDYGGPRATPTVDGDRLFTVRSDGILLCLATTNGAVLWERDLRQELQAVPPRWGFAFSPLVAGNRVFAMPGGTAGNSLTAFDRKSGKPIWSTQSDTAGYSSPVGTTIDGVQQVIFFTGRRLLAVTPDQGELLWQFPWSTPFEVNAATPLVIRAKDAAAGHRALTYVFISSGYGKGCALIKVSREANGSFQARPVWQSNELCCHFASPVRHKAHLYGLDEERDLTCLDLRTGKVAWRFARENDETNLRNRGFKKGSLLRVDDMLIVLGEDGKLALVACDPSGYRELAAMRPFRNRCWTMPVLADGRLFLRDQRQILCLDIRKR